MNEEGRYVPPDAKKMYITGEPVEVERCEKCQSRAQSFIYLSAKFYPPYSNTEKVMDGQRRCGLAQLLPVRSDPPLLQMVGFFSRKVPKFQSL